jgi:hypothetical protein
VNNTLKNIKNGETTMAEDALVQMLLEVAGGAVADERDVELARAAARWAQKVAGWQLHLHNSFVVEREGLCFWILGNRAEQVLEIRARITADGPYRTHVRHRIAHLGHGLDVLAGEDLIPARFCTLGRRALDDHAEALDRAADELWRLAHLPGVNEGEGEWYDWELKIRSATLNMAADRARAFPRGELAVTS